MTSIAINYVSNPLSRFWNSMMRAFMIIGYARAARELANLGHYEEAKRCMMMSNDIKLETNENLSGWV